MRGVIVVLLCIGLGSWAWHASSVVAPDPTPGADDSGQDAGAGPLLIGNAPLSGPSDAQSPSPVTDGRALSATKELVVEVVDRRTKALISGATVRTHPSGDGQRLIATTDAKGVARFPPANVARYAFEVVAENYCLAREERERDEFGAQPVRIEMRRGVPFDGTVVDQVSRRLIAGASVFVKIFGHFVPVAETDQAGRFHVPGVERGESIYAECAGYARALEIVVLDGSQVSPSPFVIEMERGVALVGRVLDFEGTPVSGADVLVLSAGNPNLPRNNVAPQATAEQPEFESPEYDDPRALRFDEISDMLWLSDNDFTARSDADGRFHVQGLKPGVAYTTSARADGHAPSITIPLKTGQHASEHRLDFALRRGATLVVRLRSPDGTVLSGTRVDFQHANGRHWVPRGNSAGTYRIKDLLPAAGRIVAHATGWPPAVLPVTLRAGETHEFDVEMSKGASIEGTVIDEHGEPVADATVHVALASLNEGRGDQPKLLFGSRYVSSDARGRFRIDALIPEAHVLIADRVSSGIPLAAIDVSRLEPLSTRGALRLEVPRAKVRVVVYPVPRVRARLLTPDGRPYSGRAQSHFYERTARGRRAFAGHLIVKRGVIEKRLKLHGKYAWSVAAEGFAWLSWNFDATDRSIDLGDVTLSKGLTLTGLVADETGSPIPDANVRCRQAAYRITKTDDKGRFSMSLIPQRSFQLEVSTNRHGSKVIEVDTRRDTAIRVVLPRAVVVEGSVSGIKAARWEAIEFRRPNAQRVEAAHPYLFGKTFTAYEGSPKAWVDVDRNFHALVLPGRYEGYWTDHAGTEHRMGEWTFVLGETYDLKLIVSPTDDH